LNIGEKIKFLRINLELTQEELALAAGTTKQTIHKYETGIISNIPASKIKLLADRLNTTPAYLMGWEELPKTDDRFPSPAITEDYTTFPVIGEIAAGYDHIATENWEGEKIDIPNSYLKGRKPADFFVLLVKGDSMYPMYQEGDKVLILKQTTLNYSGQIGAIIYNAEDCATLKKIEYAPGEDWLKLVPINPNCPPIMVEDNALEHCRVLGIPRLVIREIN